MIIISFVSKRLLLSLIVLITIIIIIFYTTLSLCRFDFWIDYYSLCLRIEAIIIVVNCINYDYYY